MRPDAELEALVERIRAAHADASPLAIVGHGSKDFVGGAIVGEPLCTTALSGISSYEPTELVVTARAGTPLAELEAALAERGQCLPFEPPRFGTDAGRSGTVGGMVAAGLAGPSRAAVGGVRDYVLGAVLLNGCAELLSFGGQVIKNVAGYDVSRLLAGSMGELGLICEVSLKVLPTAPAQATLRFECDEATALRQLNVFGGKPLPINASAWWNGTLLLRLRGARAAVDAALNALGGELIDESVAQPFWRGLRDQRDEFFVKVERQVDAGAPNGVPLTLWRVSVPQTAPVLPLPGEQLIEWGGAQRWWCTPAPASVVREMARDRGGHATLWREGGEHPRRSAAEVHAPLAPPLDRIHRQLKAAFDPAGIFNRGRLLP
ncbi:glycolate oxidase subunit GlcE [Rivibacter subsaxonicus]|uniref:glycolate oxidase subunit GlcE n=1 Tax=Rivibacter subsaxonicus TaxID=457575 RepID=UPI003BF8FA1B